MNKKLTLSAILGASCLLLSAINCLGEQMQVPIKNTTALVQAHAHNDYDHKVPLFDALNHGFTRIEPDIFILYKDNGKLIDDKLAHFNKDGNIDNYEIMAGHNAGEYKGTLYNLYIKPMEKLKKGQFVFEGYNKPILYMIDMKTNYPGSVEFMNKYLSQFSNIFNNYNAKLQDKPINVILSGYNGSDFNQKDLDFLLNTKERYLGIDGRVDKPLLGQNQHPELFPLISNSWDNRSEKTFKQNIIDAHDNGHQIRFWGTKDNKKVWEKMYKSGADVISSDNLAGVQKYLLSQKENKNL